MDRQAVRVAARQRNKLPDEAAAARSHVKRSICSCHPGSVPVEGGRQGHLTRPLGVENSPPEERRLGGLHPDCGLAACHQHTVPTHARVRWRRPYPAGGSSPHGLLAPPNRNMEGSPHHPTPPVHLGQRAAILNHLVKGGQTPNCMLAAFSRTATRKVFTRRSPSTRPRRCLSRSPQPRSRCSCWSRRR